jgi:hypothetical protein
MDNMNIFQENMMNIPFEWLLAGPPNIQYRTRLDLLQQGEFETEVVNARKAMLLQPEINALLSSIKDWPGSVLSSHKSANQSFHTLNFLADLGFISSDPELDAIISRILENASPEGPFSLSMNIGAAHGGTGENTSAWALCDAPNLLYALKCFGLKENVQVKKAEEYLINLVQLFGWPCAVSPELGNFRGPGKKNDPCPYANLAMLKVLSLTPESRTLPAAKIGIETLLTLWQNRRDSHPYIFYMGTDFCKLKAPLIWYDILHVLDVLSRFPGVPQDFRFQEMLKIAIDKITPEGTFIPESVYNPYKEWDFGQKKVASRWITFLMYRIMQRI